MTSDQHTSDQHTSDQHTSDQHTSDQHTSDHSALSDTEADRLVGFPRNSMLTIFREDSWIDQIPLRPVVRIGRDADNLIRFPEDSISRHHCVLRWNSGVWQVIDLNSSNGTFVNGQKTTKQSEVSMSDTISLGPYLLRIVSSDSINENLIEETPGTDTKLSVEVAPVAIKSVGVAKYFRESEIAATQLGAPGAYAALFQLATQLASASDRTTLANLTLQRALQSTRTDIGAVLLFDESSNHAPQTIEDLRSVAFASSGSDVYQPSSQLSNNVLECGEGVLAVDAGSCKQFASGSAAKSMICVPIRSERDVLGLIHVYSQDSSRMLTIRELECCMAAAQLLGASLCKLRNAGDRSNAHVRVSTTPTGLIGDSAAMQQLHTLAKTAADSDCRALIYGETGTGKSTVARYVHEHSKRAGGSFIRLDCATLGSSLGKDAAQDVSFVLESLRHAEGGTLFLDNVETLPADIHTQFASILDTCVSMTNEQGVSCDVRVIAASTVSPSEMLSQNKMDAKLLFRICELALRVPALRERTEDFLQLMKLFLSERLPKELSDAVKIPKRAIAKLADLPWPGNIRQLQMFVAQKTANASETASIDWMDVQHSNVPDPLILDQTNLISLAEVENRYVAFVLKCVDGNKSKAAEILGISRSTLDRKTAT